MIYDCSENNINTMNEGVLFVGAIKQNVLFIVRGRMDYNLIALFNI